jgi:hypothetical protein
MPPRGGGGCKPPPYCLSARGGREMSRGKLTETGSRGSELVCKELDSRGYKTVAMPNHNPGFDIDCKSPSGGSFEVEVKCSTSIGTQVPLQVRSHLEAALRLDRFYIFVRGANPETAEAEFYVLTHEEVQGAWALMPKLKPDGQPYVIGSTGYIDWRHINHHRDRWDKLPK